MAVLLLLRRHGSVVGGALEGDGVGVRRSGTFAGGGRREGRGRRARGRRVEVVDQDKDWGICLRRARARARVALDHAL